MTIFTILIVCCATVSSTVKAIEDPPGCSLANGGNGASYQNGLNFALTEAHIGDAVPVFPSFGMIQGACRAINVTGSVYIATGKLTNFLNNATLDPGLLATGANPPCEPGPYNILITPALVGAGVSSPHGSIAGVPNTVRAMENVDGTVLSGSPPETLNGGCHTASITIVTPALQVVQQPAYPQGQACFLRDQEIVCTGYVTNCGDITLTNVVLNSGTGPVQLFCPTNGLPFAANATLPPGVCATFTNRCTPTPQEIGAGRASTTITSTARDTTTIGGSNALVANAITTSSVICGDVPVTLSKPEYTADHQFRFNVTGREGTKYVIQAATSLNSKNWVSIYTNTAPFTFMDGTAALCPMRVYRAETLTTIINQQPLALPTVRQSGVALSGSAWRLDENEKKHPKW